MKGHSYIDCATDELIRSSIEEEYFWDRSTNEDFARFRERSPSQVVYKIAPTDIALPYPFLLTLFVEGRIVVRADAEIGWQHQGLEKSMEQSSWLEAGQLLKRINSNENSSLRLAYTLAVEKLFGQTAAVSLYERLLRIVMLESERIFHHLKIIGRVSELITTALKQEPIRKGESISKKLCTLLRNDSDGAEAYQNEIKNTIESLREISQTIVALLKDDRQLRNRLEGKSVVDRATAVSLGFTGIYLRAAGVNDDVRKNHPNLPYFMLDFQPQTLLNGDAYSRFLLRLREMETSLLLMSQALRLAAEPSVQSSYLEAAPRQSLDLAKPEACQVETSFLEAPEGELAITLCSNAQPHPYRVRIKTPSFALMAGLSVFLRGHDLDDVVLILNTLGINTLEVDR